MFVTFHDGLFLAGKSGGNLSESLTLDSIVMCLWLDFTIPPRENMLVSVLNKYTIMLHRLSLCYLINVILMTISQIFKIIVTTILARCANVKLDYVAT